MVKSGLKDWQEIDLPSVCWQSMVSGESVSILPKNRCANLPVSVSPLVLAPPPVPVAAEYTDEDIIIIRLGTYSMMRPLYIWNASA